MTHTFDVDVAKEYGVNPAILLQNITTSCLNHKANESNFYDGYYWMSASISAFEELFPYMSTHQVRAALLTLLDDGLILKGNYNESPYDRTAWYTVTEKGMDKASDSRR